MGILKPRPVKFSPLKAPVLGFQLLQCIHLSSRLRGSHLPPACSAVSGMSGGGEPPAAWGAGSATRLWLPEGSHFPLGLNGLQGARCSSPLPESSSFPPVLADWRQVAFGS